MSTGGRITRSKARRYNEQVKVAQRKLDALEPAYVKPSFADIPVALQEHIASFLEPGLKAALFFSYLGPLFAARTSEILEEALIAEKKRKKRNDARGTSAFAFVPNVSESFRV